MDTPGATLASQIAIRSGLERLSGALRKEHALASGNFHLLSDDQDEVESLYRAALTLTTAQVATVQLIASKAMRQEALSVMRALTARVRKEMSEEWQRGHFRASEALSRTVTLIIAAGEDLAASS